MPYRLRIAFAASAARSLPCERGLFVLTGKSATTTYVPNAVIADTWSLISNPAYVYGDNRAGPRLEQGWWRGAVHTGTGNIYVWQAQPSASNYGSFVFSQSAGEWSRLNTVTTDWKRNFSGLFENYDMCYDPDRNRFLRSCGAPFPPLESASPHWGDGEYYVADDEWHTPYPKSSATYSPLPADAGYYGTPGNSLQGFIPCYRYYGGYIYQFGGFSVDAGQALKRRDVSTGTITTAIAWASCPPWTSGPARETMYRSGLNTRTKRLWTFANNWALYECDLLATTLAWSAVTTTGVTPTVPVPTLRASQGETDTQYGVHAVVDEAANCMVAWCGQNSDVTDIGETNIQQTWIMDLATRVWRNGPALAFGNTVPRAKDGVVQNLLYDPVSRRTILLQAHNGFCEVYALQIAPIGGIITSWPLPTQSGSTYGVNYYGFPFVSNGGSKQSFMAYCPQDGRVYAQGGDTIHSATDGTWSMDPSDGSWTLEVGEAEYGVTVAPHALQDGFGIAWVASQNKFILWPGSTSSYYPYPAPIDTVTYPVQNYSMGYWWFDPLTSTYTQDLRLWGSAYSGSGCDYGGAWDDVNEYIITFRDSSASKAVRRFNPNTGTQVTPDIALTYTDSPTLPAAYFARSKPVTLGRWAYCLGYRTNGNVSSQQPFFFRWNMDTHVTEELTAPPINGPSIVYTMLQMGVSNGKIVFPFTTGPEGDISGLYVYNPANNTWFTETKRPAYGNFLMNSMCSLPDGRVMIAGGNSVPQQTHVWFYEAT